MTPLSTPTSPTGLDLSLEDVREAASRLEGRVHRTPCWESRTFSELCGGRVWLKYENLQRTGSYKLRGALNRILTLPADARQRGVIAASAGNHGQGVAVAAQLAGVSATIVMPSQAPLAKVSATKGYGARVILHGEVFDEAHAEALRIAEQEGLTYVHPFDDPAVMACQGTVALEILEAAPEVDTLVVPIGADGLLTRAPGQQTLPLIRRYVDDVVTVTDEAIAETVVLLMERAKTVAEPAGAVALAALLSGAVAANGHRSCAVIS